MNNSPDRGERSATYGRTQEQDKAARCSIPSSGFIIGQFKSWSFAKALPLSPIAPSDSAARPDDVAPLIHGPTNAPSTGGGEGRIAGYGRVVALVEAKIGELE